MALIQQNEKDKKQESQLGMGGQPATTTSAAPATTQAPGAPQQPAASGRFSNLQKYVRANVGSNLAQNIGGKVVGQAEGVKSDVRGAQEKFGQAAKAGRIATEAEEQQFKGAVGNAAGYQGPGFTKLLTGQYQGPKDLGGAQALQQRAQSTQALGQAAGTAAGQQGLLTQFYARPQYTGGQQKFDVGLLGRDRSGALQQARAKTGGLEGVVRTAQQGAIEQGETFRLQDELRKQQAQQAFEGAVGGVSGEMSAAASAEAARRRAIQEGARHQLRTGKVGGQLAQDLGINVDQEYYVNPEDFLQMGTTDIAKEVMANQQQIARLGGLQKLAGGYQSGQMRDINFANLGKGVSDPIYTVNKAGFQQAQARAAEEIAPLKQAVQSAAHGIEAHEKRFNALGPELQKLAVAAFQKRERGEDIEDIGQMLSGGIPGVGKLQANTLADMVAEGQALRAQQVKSQQELASRYPSIKRFVRG